MRSENRLYPELLVELLSQNGREWDVFNNCKSRLLASELIDYRDTLSRQNPDIIVLNIGAVDAPNREIPKWYSDILFRRKWLFLHRFSLILYNAIIKKYLRKPLVFIRMKSPWVQPKKFEKSIIEFLEFIRKDLKSQVAILGINPGNERIESELPGTLVRYKDYNQRLKAISEKYQCSFIDTTHLDSESYFPDGVHYNVKGHHWCANQIYQKLTE